MELMVFERDVIGEDLDSEKAAALSLQLDIKKCEEGQGLLSRFSKVQERE